MSLKVNLYCIMHACSVAQSCTTLCNPMYYRPPGSSVHGIAQARILEWVAISSSKGSFQPWDQTQVFCIGRRIFFFFFKPLSSLGSLLLYWPGLYGWVINMGFCWSYSQPTLPLWQIRKTLIAFMNNSHWTKQATALAEEKSLKQSFLRAGLCTSFLFSGPE